MFLLKRFPQTIVIHSPGLLYMIVQGINLEPDKYEKMLVNEVIPLIYNKTLVLPPHLVCTIFTVCLQHYVKKLVEEMWKKVFVVLEICGTMLKWDTNTIFPYNKSWTKL